MPAVFALLLALSPLARARNAGDRRDGILREFLWDQLTALPAGERPTIGVAFSGGGARAFAHVGVIEQLERAGFPADVVSGTSMGALVGVAFADKIPSKRMKELVRHASLSEGTDLSTIHFLTLLISDSLLSTKPIEDYLKAVIGGKRFDELKRSFACVATDIKTGEKIVFTEGQVAPAVRASMNIPGVFAPVQYRHRYLVDGGIVDFLPVDAAKQLGADWVLASITEGDYTSSTFPNVLFTLEQVIDIGGSLLARPSKQAADAVIDPNVGQIKVYEMSRSEEAYEAGVLAARKKLKPVEESLLLFSMPAIMKKLGSS